MVSIKLSERTTKDLKGLDEVTGRRIIDKLFWLQENFDNIVPKRLHGDLRDFYTLRVGDYRAVYSVRRNRIAIEAIDYRRDVYK